MDWGSSRSEWFRQNDTLCRNVILFLDFLIMTEFDVFQGRERAIFSGKLGSRIFHKRQIIVNLNAALAHRCSFCDFACSLL